jgi:hypothetical protein
MFVFKRAQHDKRAAEAAQETAKVATTAALIFAFFAAVRIAPYVIAKVRGA